MKEGDPKLDHECERFCHSPAFFCEIITTFDLFFFFFFLSVHLSFLNDLPQLAQVTVSGAWRWLPAG